MKKLFFNLVLFIIFTFITITVTLSTIGIKTDKFNNLISKKINDTNNNVNININKIKFKLDVKAISLFLETRDTEVNYRDLKIPVKNIKVYIDFLSLIKIEPKIKKITLNFYQLNQDEIKKISSYLKPSNFTSFINNKLKKIELNTELEIYLDRNNLIENFISRGSVSNLKFEILNKINLENTRFTFFADKSDILLKNISSSTDSLKILDGDLKINLSKEISLDTNFKTLIKSDSKNKQLQKLVNQFRLAENLVKIEADLNNMIKLSLDKTLKIRKFNYSGKGNISKAQFNFDNPISNNFLIEKVNNLSFVDLKFDINSNFKKTISNISGKYSIDKTRPLSFSLRSNFIKDLINLDLVFDYTNAVEIDFINYRKSKDVNSKIAINLDKKKNNYVFNKISFSENKNSILAQGISIDNERFLSAKKISVLTNKDGRINNNFSIIFEKKMKINGKKFDASNLPKILNQNKKKIDFSSLNKEIEIDFTNIILPLSENLSNFKLIGKIENGKFSKISSKGDFGYNNFLDVTMKNDKKSKKKYLEIYSDLTKPLLTEFKFFEGLTGGNLLYTSIIDESSSTSKLKIENFKVVNAPGMVKLLSIADLSGLADLAQGEGLSFDILEINIEKNKDLLKLTEILALGPSISVLMEGYQDAKITSFKGTLIPAKTLNTLISKIPVLGEIIIPKEIGEGLFGISFKMKGPPGKIKTTINPIRTITPRFIQKIIEKNKNSK